MMKMITMYPKSKLCSAMPTQPFLSISNIRFPVRHCERKKQTSEIMLKGNLPIYFAPLQSNPSSSGLNCAIIFADYMMTKAVFIGEQLGVRQFVLVPKICSLCIGITVILAWLFIR
jgi:hypothetical protein